jgi:hypothetical protein
VKTISVTRESAEINALLDQARNEDILIVAPDGTEFMVSAVEDFDAEIARTRKNPELMAELDRRAKQSETVPLKEVKRQLGLE